MLPKECTTTLQQLADFCAARNVSAWLVGGTARDIALGHMPVDLDVAVNTDGVVLARDFADTHNASFVPLDLERGVGRVVCAPTAKAADHARLVIDIVQLRAPTLADDLRLRDFTVNALALPLTIVDGRAFNINPIPPEAFVDPCGGLRDLAARAMRVCGPTSLRDDPLRILRALRFAAALELSITPELDAALRAATPLITQPAAERIRDELLKLLQVPYATPWLKYLDDLGGLTRIFPELEPARTCDQPIVHFLPVLAHSLEAVACLEWLLGGLTPASTSSSSPPPPNIPIQMNGHLPVAVQTYPDLPRLLQYSDTLRDHFSELIGSGHPRSALCKLATLLHDNAKPQTKQSKQDGGVSFYGHQEIGAQVAATIAHRLRLSRSESAYVTTVVRAHMRPGQLRGEEHVTPRAVARFFRDTGDAGPDILLHALADHMATRGPHIDREDWRNHIAWTNALLDTQWAKAPEQTHPLLDGNDVMDALNIAPSPLVGKLLREIHDAQAAGEIQTRDEALALAHQMIATILMNQRTD